MFGDKYDAAESLLLLIYQYNFKLEVEISFPYNVLRKNHLKLCNSKLDFFA